MAPKTIIEIDGLSKKFKSKTVLKNLSLNISEGEIFGLIGPNGSGKTTLINILLGLISPDQGSIKIFGKKLDSNLSLIHSQINTVSAYNHLQDQVGIMDNLITYARLYNVKKSQIIIEELLNFFELKKYAQENRNIATLSSGEHAKLLFCKSLINQPKILFLDEPTASLDPIAAKKIRCLILDIYHKTKSTILLVSHNLDEVKSLCNRVALIKNGEIVKIVDNTKTESLIKLY